MRIIVPEIHAFANHSPVLIDDIVSTARTMIEAARHLKEQGFVAPVCMAVHALFSEDSYSRLRNVASQVVTTDAVPHASNGIEVSPIIAQSLREMI